MTLSLPPTQNNRFHYNQYRCAAKNPLHCEQSQRSQESNLCSKCLFPSVLPEQSKLRGQRGTYVIEEFLTVRGLGRLYRGYQELEDRSVIIREYVLPTRCFNTTEIRQRQRAFAGLTGISLADGRSQDFRLITPYDAIADQSETRCYLITLDDYNAYSTLQSQLPQLGTMPAIQVRRVIAQILQSLELLHRQKFRLPNGQIEAQLVHGNLSLETILIQPQTEWHDEFVIYLTDLALWERLFIPTQLALPKLTIADDLKALGQIGIQLLSGKSSDSDLPCSPAFEAFLLRLIGAGQPFENLETVRQVFKQLPPEPISESKIAPIELEQDDPKHKINWKKWGLLCLALLGIGALVWWLSLTLRPKPRTSSERLVPKIESVSDIPSGRFNYTGEQRSLWSYVSRQKNLIQQGKNLETILQERQPKLQLNYQPEETIESAIEKVRSQQAEFLVTSLIDPVGAEFDTQNIAYDGLAVFVAFSYSNRDNSLPRFLNGQISFKQLKQLYTGEIQNWKQIGGADLPVRLYIPAEPELVRVFEQRVLRDQQSIQKFRKLRESSISELPTFDSLRQVLRDFEQEQVGSIAFGSLSQVYGQCLVYPLALIEGNRSPVAPLLLDSGKPITPQIDLCTAKGSYDRNFLAFQTQGYPLMYSLAVVSARNNARPPVGRKFASILRTIEGQSLLDKTGLIPLSKTQKNSLP
ncbi:putative serine/threonine kinase [Leptolyngbya sp. NIES-3755]|nr:putative serine/threonine kinase [Leptolyngbya sp. NIES-3755]